MLNTIAISCTKLQIKYPPLSASQEFMNPFSIHFCITTTEIYLPQPIHLTVSKRCKILRQRIPPRDSLRDSPIFSGLEIVPLPRATGANEKHETKIRTMSSNIPIAGSFTKMSLSTSPPVSSSFDLNMSRMSTSPGYSTSPPDHFKGPSGRRLTRSGTDNVKQLKPFASADIKIRISCERRRL